MTSRRSVLATGTVLLTSTLLSHAEKIAPAQDRRNILPQNIETHYRTANVNGVEIFYREAGTSNRPALVLLHGYPTSSRMFRRLIPMLAAHYRVIAPDYPAFGHSAVPSPREFTYTHEHISEVIDALLTQLGVEDFGLYVMDFGGPIGYRLMLKYPDRFRGVVVQNTPAFGESTDNPIWATLLAYWKDKSPANREKVRPSIEPDAIRHQYIDGVRDPSLIDPDNWTIDSALIARPGVGDIMLDLLFDIKNNRSTVAAAREFFARHQHLVMVATGVNDPLFPGDTMKPPPTMPGIEFHPVDSGHFALEDKCDDIGAYTLNFFKRTMKP